MRVTIITGKKKIIVAEESKTRTVHDSGGA